MFEISNTSVNALLKITVDSMFPDVSEEHNAFETTGTLTQRLSVATQTT
jgi:hypothetical protein